MFLFIPDVLSYAQSEHTLNICTKYHLAPIQPLRELTQVFRSLNSSEHPEDYNNQRKFNYPVGTLHPEED